MTRHLVSDGLDGGLIDLDDSFRGGDLNTWSINGSGWINNIAVSSLDAGYWYYAHTYVNGYVNSSIHYNAVCLFDPGMSGFGTDALINIIGGIDPLTYMRFRISGGYLQSQEVSSGGSPAFSGHCRKCWKT